MHSGKAVDDVEDVKLLASMNNEDLTATLMKHVRYFDTKNSLEKFMKKKLHFLTVWIVTDLNKASGVELLRSGLEYLKSSTGVRLTFIPNADKIDGTKNDVNAIVWSMLNTFEPKEAVERVLRYLDGDKDIPDTVKGFMKTAELHLKMLRVYCQRVLKFKSGVEAVITNGRIFGPLDEGEKLTVDDFNLLDKINQQQYISKVKEALKSVNEDFDVEISSEMMTRLLSLLMPRTSSKSRFKLPAEMRDEHTVVKLPAKAKDEPKFDIIAILDPASRGAQKLSALLILLRQVINCDLKIFLCAVDKHSDMPVKNFYRYVIEPELQFTADGRATSGPVAKFSGLPANPLLTQNLAVPENWLADLIRSVYDLDNIRLSEIGGPVHSEYELEYLLLEGHCFDSSTGSPPRGLQFNLGTKDDEAIVDTIVMANLGYFQLKANPGAWTLRLRPGKSSEIYDITNVEGLNTIHSVKEGTVSVVINSFSSHVLKVRVTKKPEMMHVDLLGDEDQAGGIWNSITSTFTGTAGEAPAETINIFSVASGE